MDLTSLFPYAVLMLWAVSLIINRKIVERRISALEERIDSVEKGSARSRSVGPTRSSGPRR